MKKLLIFVAAAFATGAYAASPLVEAKVQRVPQPATELAVRAAAPIGVVEPTSSAPVRAVTLPVNSLVEVTPFEEITSKKMKEGTTRTFLVVNDVAYEGRIIVPRGSQVQALVTWRTGKGIIGKSAKFELSFESVRINGRNYQLRGVYRQEGRGNTAGALLGAAIITGKSAVMLPGQIVNVFTAEPISTY